MSWERILQNDEPGQPLRRRIDDLFAQQRATWPTLRDGEASLQHLERKLLTSGGDSIIVQMNPARRRSTLANTDAKAVAARACFLCPDNMPTEERGVAFDDLVLLPNPFPILPLHCTVADREHRPQTIQGRINTFLHLAQEIGPDMAALYNGPRCGASAPDHFHLQAARANEIPILAQLSTIAGNQPIVPHASFGRHMLIFRGTNAADVAADIERSINTLQQLEATTDEPMLNLLAHFTADRSTVILFPRAAHRPACYFTKGADQLLISPAVLEMAGILVTTEPDHFARIDARAARTIYEDVSINAARFEDLVATI
jgi:ATP adenylyltransferase/5',5'''-P-1,P-4-tetraphosphate phosphorylase II